MTTTATPSRTLTDDIAAIEPGLRALGERAATDGKTDAMRNISEQVDGVRWAARLIADEQITDASTLPQLLTFIRMLTAVRMTARLCNNNSFSEGVGHVIRVIHRRIDTLSATDTAPSGRRQTS
jgi:hypothetical protein